MDFNPAEVYKIAERLETLGINFYQKAAGFIKDENLKSILNDLTEMEKTHFQLFSSMEKKAKSCSYADTDEVTAYIGEKFGPSIFKDDDSLKIGNELANITDIFRIAMEKELDSVRFYTLIKNMVSQEETKATLDRIIQEEKGHVELIKDYLSRLIR